jgi:hypothetical protein
VSRGNQGGNRRRRGRRNPIRIQGCSVLENSLKPKSGANHLDFYRLIGWQVVSLSPAPVLSSPALARAQRAETSAGSFFRTDCGLPRLLPMVYPEMRARPSDKEYPARCRCENGCGRRGGWVVLRVTPTPHGIGTQTAQNGLSPHPVAYSLKIPGEKRAILGTYPVFVFARP